MLVVSVYLGLKYLVCFCFGVPKGIYEGSKQGWIGSTLESYV